MNTHALRIEGGLFGPDLIAQLLAAELPGQTPADFGLSPRRTLADEIAAVYHDARAQWRIFQHRLERLPEDASVTSETRELWVIPFLRLLGYDLQYQPRALEVDGLSLPISHLLTTGPEGAPTLTPVHIVGCRQELGRLAPSGRPRLSPHALVQEYLNRSEALWGLVTNGRTLRLLRNSTFVRRQAYVEFDLPAILEEDRFQDFAALYRLLHRTRLPAEGRPEDCLLERYYQRAVEQGGRVREHLREGVERCIEILANGFLSHPANDSLRRSFSPFSSDREPSERSLPPSPASGEGPGERVYHQLLRLVYRFLFLLVSEERGLMGRNPLYLQHYGVGRLRRLCESRAAYTEDADLWLGLCALWETLRDEKLAAILGVPPLNGDLFALQELDGALITNRDLLKAFYHLAFYDDPPRRVNYAALDTEELGSVYESLLELHPRIEWQGNRPSFCVEARGEERRSTGSHYTPPELVTPLIQHTLEPILERRLANCRTNEEKQAAILNLKVLDPACGSGHFLLAAARRLGKELARLRTGEDEPAPEAVHQGVRDAITHCLYGVDKNPLAVELCRVALWLEGHEKDKPLTFLEHRIRHGDSLLGVRDLAALEAGIPDEAYKPLGKADRARLSEARKRNARERAASLFQHGFVSQPLAEFAERLRRVAAMPEETIEQVRAKRAAYQQVQSSPEFQRLQLACDLYTAAFFHSSSPALITTSAIQEALSCGLPADPRVAGQATALRVERAFFHWALEFAEVFVEDEGTRAREQEAPSAHALRESGFDVILGNPPFMGGLRVSGRFGEAYRRWLECAFAPFGGTADLCAAFFRRAFSLLRPGGRLGMIATNTLSQGDTRESGLAVILRQGGFIHFVQRFVQWPGQANVEVNLVAITKLPYPHGRGVVGEAILDSHPVPFISSRLDDQPEQEPRRLKRNEGKAFQGDIVRGIGFVLEPQEAEALLSRNPRHRNCLFPYLNGEDLNSHPEQQPNRWVICFHDWPLERARQYPELLKIVEERVKPERDRLTGPGDKRNREFWWQFGAYRSGMRQAIAPLERVLVRATVSDTHAIAFVPNGWIYNHKTILFAFYDNYHFALLQSSLHEYWMRRYTSTMRTDVNYSPSDCFDTFPFPPIEYATPNLPELLAGAPFARAAQLGGEYHEHRRRVMLARGLGLTKTYNLFHNPACQDEDIVRLRELHAEMDRAILACYGWQDLELQHDFYRNERGQTRFMPSAEARRALMFRLMALNEQMAREER
ncbi:MAG: N-6 DNA methylase [Thermoflexales bacterium]|nr:N-6 DNA methylase [Thermoflexales bacterium]